LVGSTRADFNTAELSDDGIPIAVFSQRPIPQRRLDPARWRGPFLFANDERKIVRRVQIAARV